MAAHGLVPAQEQAATLIKVSDHLGVPALREQYLLVAADLALNAKDKGCPGSLDHFMGLMLAAAEKSTQHASFPAAKRFLDGYESKSTVKRKELVVIDMGRRYRPRGRSRDCY